MSHIMREKATGRTHHMLCDRFRITTHRQLPDGRHIAVAWSDTASQAVEGATAEMALAGAARVVEGWRAAT